MPVDRDGHRRPLASTERLHNLWRNFQAPHGLRRLDVGSKLHNLLLPTLVSSPCSCAAPPGSERCGVPREPVRVCEGPGTAANHEPVRSGAVGETPASLARARRRQSANFTGLDGVANSTYLRPKLVA